jgi:predicted nucleic acid-binding protein
MIVIDASLFGKLFLEESDRDRVNELIEHSINHNTALLAPTLIIYEALSIGIRHNVPFDQILGLLDRICAGGLEVVEPSRAELLRAEQITTTGSKGAGYPALTDSVYHAMAIERGGVFVTADRRHVAKTKHFGHVAVLADWRPG